ncbi:MAG: hypothetical protein H0W72_06260 [Planctomycetes bacterium]|nr:hypothetical protein [Planctomycetota bacterium]
MHDTDRLLQRYVDGELGADQAAAVGHLVAADAGAAARLRRFEGADRLLAEHADGLPSTDADEFLRSIMRGVPQQPPKRHASVRLGDVLLASSLVATFALLAGLSRTCADLVPLTLVALVSMIVGLVLVAAAKPLIQGERALLGRILGKRVGVGEGGVLAYRVAGVAIVLGGIWMVS